MKHHQTLSIAAVKAHLWHFIALFAFAAVSFSSCVEDEGTYDIYTLPIYAGALESMNMPRPEGSYNYPIIPGSDAWRAFTSRDEKEKACQVPKRRLKHQSTQAVIQALWEYPLNWDMFAWENTQKGYEFVFHPLNAYKELTRRDDAAQCLLDRYQVIKEKCVTYPMGHLELEMHLAQYSFIDQLTSSQRKAVVARTIDIMQIREADPKYAGRYSLDNVSIYMAGRMMMVDKYPPFLEALRTQPGWDDYFKYDPQMILFTTEIITTFLDLAYAYVASK